jgi:GMP synthase (glutamine-hydrolysing)
MLRILIVESNPPEYRAYAPIYAGALRGIAPSLDITSVAPYAGEALEAATIDAADGVVFTGSSVSWSTDAPEAEPLRSAMRVVFDRKVPSYGSCNGLQLAVAVLGGAVGASPNGCEDGVARDITVTEAGQSHPMMAGRGATYASLSIHRDEVTALPDGATLLSGNAHSPVQAMAYEQDGVIFWGSQYHPELQPDWLAAQLEKIGRLPPDTCAALARAATDPDAAAQLGVAPENLASDALTLELRNWLEMLKERSKT